MKLNFNKISYQWVFFLSCLSCYSQLGTVAKLSPKKVTVEKKVLGTAILIYLWCAYVVFNDYTHTYVCTA
jgi:hypothetical protein